ncbi:hypothetical protein [Pseudomonas sp. R5(2019)]|uniref:hypothetical protein n=1 Tax=Pseudomonas sp. R5(2019) TaxID=2697566 RepID=UPI0014133291|nr:hypothetical protein [Pseudomonas sp. R5(2019)]NBA93454.1 hypothetical protein [Pseudomonas sp. R5(2019)]
MNAPGRKAGCVKTGGRKRGTLDKAERLLVTEIMAADILKVYKRLGPDWLFNVAKERPDLFLNQCLSRLLPPPIREDADTVQFNQQVNFTNLDHFEAARRIAFALNLGLHAQREFEPAIKHPTLQESCQVPRPDTVPLVQPEVVEDADRDRWAQELKLTPEERRDNAVVRATHGGSLETYAGSAAEQALTRKRELL